MSRFPATSDTFTDAQGRHYIAGQGVPAPVWESYDAAWSIIPCFEEALDAICGPRDSGPFMDVYRTAGGGYEGLQAIARAALSQLEEETP